MTSATPPHTPPSDLEAMIDAALAVQDPTACNAAITQAHYALGQALRAVTGEGAGANFHAWAVWGSRKAGVTIRQEDLDAALRDASVVAAATGAAIGATCAALGMALWPALVGGAALYALLLVVGMALGTACGAAAGRAAARWSRREAARLVLAGNRLVLDDIGRQTARFVAACAASAASAGDLSGALSGLDPTPSERGGQGLLLGAFTAYAAAAKASAAGDAAAAQQATYHANMQAILHEHIKLQPYIRGAMPWIVRRCVTTRMMTYDVGPLRLSVSHAVPSLDALTFPPSLRSLTDPNLRALITGPCGWREVPTSAIGSGARDWSDLRQRMRYIANLFRALHLDPAVFSAPSR